jgi:hypothetical protein
MLDISAIRPMYDFYLTYAHKLVDDIPDERMCEQPVAGVTMNHAAFLIGHLAWANDNGCVMLGQEPQFPADLKPLFVMGSIPQGQRAAYPPKATLLSAFDAAHARLGDCVSKASPETLASPPAERMRARFPTMGHLIVGLMTGHFANHLGQLSAWRRACGHKSVF